MVKYTCKDCINWRKNEYDNDGVCTTEDIDCRADKLVCCAFIVFHDSIALTHYDLVEAQSKIHLGTRCDRCGTTQDYVVAGFPGIYCKCVAALLAKTERAMVAQDQINEMINNV